jgi:hypothetical protein
MPTLFDDIDPVTHRKVRAWKTHEKTKGVFGIVVSGTRLLEAEDSEIIAGGMNSKGDYAVALAREANLFNWGPPASPKQMTEEARRVFVNTVVYMKQFNGAKQTVWRGVTPRAETMVSYLNAVTFAREGLKQEGLSEETKSGRQFNLSRALRYVHLVFPPGVVERFGDDEEKYRALYEPNLGYVYVPHGTVAYTIDEDAKNLGIPNNELRFLEKCIELLRQPTEAVKARRLLERYTRLSFPDAKAWQQWLESSRDKLYFSDRYDYRFFTGPAAPAPPPREVQMATEEMTIGAPNEVAPVSVGTAAVGYGLPEDSASKSKIYETYKGDLVTLVVRLKIAGGWHTYGHLPDDSPSEPTTIKVELPPGARWHGDWQTPRTYPGAETGVTEYRGDAVFTRQLYFTSVPSKGKDARGARITLPGAVHYQACTEERCLPADKIPFDARISVLDY